MQRNSPRPIPPFVLGDIRHHYRSHCARCGLDIVLSIDPQVWTHWSGPNDHRASLL